MSEIVVVDDWTDDEGSPGRGGSACQAVQLQRWFACLPPSPKATNSRTSSSMIGQMTKAHRAGQVLLDDLEEVEGALAAAFREAQRVSVNVAEVATQDTQGLQKRTRVDA